MFHLTKKKTAILLIIILISISAYSFLLSKIFPIGKGTLDIALVGPLELREGKDQLNAVNLYLGGINHEVNGKKINLLLFNDGNNPATAVEIAKKICNQTNAIMVIGHYYSSTSTAAGTVYKKNEIPAITGSATAEEVTANNDWFFRTIPTNKVQALTAANSIFGGLKVKTVSIIYENDTYGISLSDNFEKEAGSLGIDIKSKTMVSLADHDLEATLEKIIQEDNQSSSDGMLYLATHAQMGARIVTAIKDENKLCPIFGSEEFSSPAFIESLNKYRNRLKPIAFYLDGIYCVTPFMSSIASKTGRLFEREYVKTYAENPSWGAACYFDAIRIAIEALRKSDIQITDHVMENRWKIRDTLAGFYSPKNSLKGVIGDLYFDGNGDITRPYLLANYINDKLVPTFFQYQQLQHDPKGTEDLFEKMLKGEIININGKLMSSVRIVYTWMDDIRVHEVDMLNDVCRIEFYLGFQFSDDYSFDSHAVEFLNSAGPVSLGKSVYDEKDGKIITRIYRITGKFRFTSDLRDYPFDQQLLPIRFQNKNEDADKTIYHLSELKTSSFITLPYAGEDADYQNRKWNIQSIDLSDDALEESNPFELQRFSEYGLLINHPQFHAEILLKRQAKGILFEVIFPFIALVLAIYLSNFSQTKQLRINAGVAVFALLINAGYHFYLLTVFHAGYIMGMEYVIFGVYLFVFMSLLLSIVIYNFHLKKEERLVRRLDLARRIGFPAILAIGAIVFIALYGGHGL